MNPSRFILVRACVFILLIAVLVRNVYAASEYSSRLWQMEEGLPHNIVQAITQTRDGYLWIGTREGIARFDGVKFQSRDLLAEIPHPSILSLLESKTGALWIGTENSGLLTLREGKVERVNLPESPQNFAVFEIHEDGDGIIWVASSAGLLRYESGKIERVGPYKGGLQSLGVDNHGTIWMAGPDLKTLAPQNATNYVPRAGTLPNDSRKIYCDSKGIFWMASGDGLTRIEDGIVSFFRKADGPSGFVSAILRDRMGELWIGSYSGLSRFANGEFVNENDANAPSYRVYAIFEDREGTLWVGSEEGLSRLTPKLFKTYTKKDGLTLNTIVAVCASKSGGVWVSAWGGGLNYLTDGTITSFGKADGLSSDFVLALHESRDGSLWAGTDYGSVINRIKDGIVTKFGRPEGFAANATTAFLEDSQGVLWIGTRDGLHRLKKNQFVHFTDKNGLSHSKINALCNGASGNIWIGTDAGLTSGNNDKFLDLSVEQPKLKVTIFSLYEDAEGWLWIGTKDRGLFRLKNGRLDVFTSKQGLFSESIYSILDDGRNNLWLNSSKGIFRLDKKQVEAVANGQRPLFNSFTYGKIDGIISSGQYKEVTQPAACQAADGRLWFRTTQGVAVVDPREITSNQLPPPVVIEEVVADKQSLDLFRRKSTDDSFALTIEPGRGELEIHYASLSFRAPEKNRFEYRLEGADLNWVKAEDRRVAYYNNLRPGKYRFHVKASNNDGVWNETGTGITLILQPHFWQTWWFYVGITLGSFLLVGGTVRAATRRKMQRNLERIEHLNAIERERTRIARDIHDDLGARLTKISMLTQLAERETPPQSTVGGHVRSIYATAREMLAQLDETVWAVNPRNDQLDRLAEYILHYAEEFFRHTSIRCRLKMSDVPPLPIAAEPRHHIFLAVKEALNNAAKHSGASEVQVQLKFEDGKFQVLIRDNGVGFDVTTNLTHGHGLENMRSRARNLHGEFHLQSEPGSGTSVELDFEIVSLHRNVKEVV